MKKLLLATSALIVLGMGSASAADLGARPSYAPPPPVYSWTGLYWGVNVGYSWGKATNDWTVRGFGTVSESQKVDGVIGGFQTGYNYQFGQWVLGFETDIQASGQKGSTTYVLPGVPVTTLNAEHKLSWFGTSRTRLGVLWTPTTLLYGTAGVAYGQVKSDYTLGVGNLSGTANFKDVRAGWTAGAGIESAIGGGWTAKLEYLYMDLGKQEANIFVPGVVGAVTSSSHRMTDNIVRVGFNYRWGGGAY